MSVERPYSDEELAYAEAYRDHLTLGEPEPDASHLAAARALLIRRELQRRWREQVRRITHRSRR